MSEDKFTRIEGPNGETIIVSKPRLVDKLPSPKDVALESIGTEDGKTSAAWLYGESGKCPR
jgi:hypothetical protein